MQFVWEIIPNRLEEKRFIRYSLLFLQLLSTDSIFLVLYERWFSGSQRTLLIEICIIRISITSFLQTSGDCGYKNCAYRQHLATGKKFSFNRCQEQRVLLLFFSYAGPQHILGLITVSNSPRIFSCLYQVIQRRVFYSLTTTNKWGATLLYLCIDDKSKYCKTQ